MLSSRWPTRLAWSLWVLSLALTMGAFALALLWASVDVTYDFTPFVLLFPGQLAWSTVGALVARRHPTHPIGWLFCAYGVGMGLALFADPYGRYALLAPSSPLPAGGLILWLAPKGGESYLTACRRDNCECMLYIVRRTQLYLEEDVGTLFACTRGSWASPFQNWCGRQSVSVIWEKQCSANELCKRSWGSGRTGRTSPIRMPTCASSARGADWTHPRADSSPDGFRHSH